MKRKILKIMIDFYVVMVLIKKYIVVVIGIVMMILGIFKYNTILVSHWNGTFMETYSLIFYIGFILSFIIGSQIISSDYIEKLEHIKLSKLIDGLNKGDIIYSKLFRFEYKIHIKHKNGDVSVTDCFNKDIIILKENLDEYTSKRNMKLIKKSG